MFACDAKKLRNRHSCSFILLLLAAVQVSKFAKNVCRKPAWYMDYCGDTTNKKCCRLVNLVQCKITEAISKPNLPIWNARLFHSLFSIVLNAPHNLRAPLVNMQKFRDSSSINLTTYIQNGLLNFFFSLLSISM